MKKILFYIDSILRPGGAEQVMVNLINYFFEKEYEILLVTDSLRVEDNVEYILHKEIKRVFTSSRNKNIIKRNVSRLNELRKVVYEYEPDLVLSFKGTPNIRLLLSTVGLRCKKVVSVRNDPYKEYGSGIRRMFANMLFLLADGCVLQTEEVKSYFFPQIRRCSKVIANPVSIIFFDTIWRGNEKTVVCVGRLEPQKNHTLLLRVFSAISDCFPEYRLVLYGEGLQEAYLKQKSRELGIADRVVFAGVTENVANVLSEASLFVLASDFEGMPNALMEAMAVGIPCIATDCPVGAPRMLFTGELSEYLTPCGDDQQLASLMLKILNLSQDERRKIGEKMKSRAEIFRPQKIYLEWERYLQNICGNM